jgi:hypothetical protein
VEQAIVFCGLFASPQATDDKKRSSVPPHGCFNPKAAVANAGVCHSRADAGPASKGGSHPNGESAEQLIS